MGDNLDRFTRSMFIVLRLAQAEAMQRGCAQITTQILLLGLVEETSSLAGLLLREHGIDAQLVRQHIDQNGDHTPLEAGTKPRLSPLVKHAIELAVDEARQLGHAYIGTEHLLLGLIRQEKSQVLDLLNRQGTDLQLLRHEILRELQPD